MIQEYLFNSNEYREAVEKYTEESCLQNIYDIDKSGCWIVSYFRSGENENTAKVLSYLHNYIVRNFNPIVLSNGCAAYYNKILYPYFNEFERKLRKFLYLKSALSQDAKNSELIKDLESKDFGEIFTLLFSDTEFVKSTKASVNTKTWQFTKDEIIAVIQKIEENTIWDKLIGKDSVPLLRSDFASVKDYRNDIMHAHSMETSQFYAAGKLIKEINKQLDEEIGKITGAKEKEQAENTRDFNSALSDAMKNMDEAQNAKSLQEQISELQSRLPTINNDSIIAALKAYSNYSSDTNALANNAIKQLINSHQWDSIQQRMQAISKIQVDIPPALDELQKLTSSAQQTVPSALTNLQESLQAFEVSPNILEAAEKAGEIIGEKIK